MSHNVSNKNSSQIQSASRYLSKDASSNNNLNTPIINSLNTNGAIKQFESINSSAAA